MLIRSQGKILIGGIISQISYAFNYKAENLNTVITGR